MKVLRRDYEYITKGIENILEIRSDNTEIKPITKRPRGNYEKFTQRKGKDHKGYTKMVRTTSQQRKDET